MDENEKQASAWLRRQNAGLWFGILFLLFSIVWFVLSFRLRYASNFGPGPGMYPRWLSGISIIVAGLYIWQSCTKQIFRMGETFPGKKHLLNVFSVFMATILFVFFLNILGFNIAGTLLLFTVLFRHYKLWQAAVISVTITVICFMIFRFCFSVPLPLSPFGF